ncbi:site-specific integrase [Methanolobus sp. ZRKC3]|uniref:tyrosine-type recombinase/integrase n=1 Tax=Methanolobus sp. ZRKC3 TaxID=3125786 RepID=UPI003248E2CD
MDRKQLLVDPIVQEWFETLNLKQHTRDGYLQGMRFYTEYTGMSPSALLEEAESEIEAGLLMRKRKIKQKMLGFRQSLTDRKLAPKTIKEYLTGAKSFYQTFDIDIPKIRNAHKVTTLEHNKKIPKKEDVQEALKYAHVRNKAIVLVGCSSGISNEGLTSLTVGDFEEGYDPETEITTLDLRRGKVGYDFVTFLTPEASRAVWDYIEWRNRSPALDVKNTEKWVAKHKIYGPDDHLFIKNEVPDRFLETVDDNDRKLLSEGIITMYQRLSAAAGKQTKKGHWNLIRAHNMRKVFNSTLLNAGADIFFVDYLMGHTLSETHSAYFRASPEKLRDTYAQYIPYLTIQKELDISESPEYQKIKNENQILQAETARHIVERSELATVKSELEEMKKHQKALSEVLGRLQANPELLLDVLSKVDES